jgi:hypothetical protein
MKMINWKKIDVDINIAGSVYNSAINGLTIVNASGNQQKRKHSLIRQVLIEYLGLPSLFEIEKKFEIMYAKQKGRYHEFDASGMGIIDLWKSILGGTFSNMVPEPAWNSFHKSSFHREPISDYIKRRNDLKEQMITPLGDGWAIKIHNVHLTEFVSRSPGRAYTFPRAYLSHQFENWNNLLRTQKNWDWQELAGRNLGLGDVRFNVRDGKYLLNAVGMERPYWGGMEVVCAPSGQKDFKYHDALSTLGFPIVITEDVYNLLRNSLQSHGVVFVEELTGLLIRVQYDFDLTWAPGVPKMCLFVGDRNACKGIRNPHMTVYCSAWTVLIHEENDDARYAHWTFRVGGRDYITTPRICPKQ